MSEKFHAQFRHNGYEDNDDAHLEILLLAKLLRSIKSKYYISRPDPMVSDLMVSQMLDRHTENLDQVLGKYPGRIEAKSLNN